MGILYSETFSCRHYWNKDFCEVKKLLCLPRCFERQRDFIYLFGMLWKLHLHNGFDISKLTLMSICNSCPLMTPLISMFCEGREFLHSTYYCKFVFPSFIDQIAWWAHMGLFLASLLWIVDSPCGVVVHGQELIDHHTHVKISFSILWHSHTGSHPHKELAKFGYRWWLRKVENFKNPAIFWQLVGTNCLNMAIRGKKFPWNPASLALFLHKKPVYEFAVDLFLATKWQNFTQKKTKTCNSCVHHSIMVL
jgi:hypothetical protein